MEIYQQMSVSGLVPSDNWVYRGGEWFRHISFIFFLSLMGQDV